MDSDALQTRNAGLVSILLAAPNGSQAVQKIWAFQKAMDSRISLAYIGKKIGLQSRGVLSETMQGKRRWPRKYWKDLGRILGLDEVHSELILLLLERDECTSAADMEVLGIRIEGLRLFLKERFFKVDMQQGLNLLASDIFCYFNMKPVEMSERTIINYFGRSRFQEIIKALQILLANGLIEKTDGGYQRNASNAKFFAFNQNEIDHALSFLRESIHDAELQVPRWLMKQKEACFGSTTMLVKRDQFEKTLVQIKKDVFRYFSQLETNDGDTIIRFNMQIYPVVAQDHES